MRRPSAPAGITDGIGSPGLSGRRADDPQPLRAAGAALRVRPQRAAVCPQHAAPAARHGGDVRRHRDARGGRWGLGRAAQHRGPVHRPFRPRRARHHAALEARGGLLRAAVRRLRQSPVTGRGPQRGAFNRAVRAARRRARLPVGALCGTHPRPHPHRRRDQRSKHGDDDIAVCLRARRHGLPRGRGAARRTRIRRIAQFARCRRMDPSRPRRRRAARGRRHRARLGHGHPDSPVIRQHESHRAGAARPAARRRRSGERSGCTVEHGDRRGAADRRSAAAAHGRRDLAQLASR